MLTKKYVGVYNQKDRDYFSLLPSDKKIVERLSEIYSKEKGIFVLSGNRGSGKSSLKNISLEKAKWRSLEKPSIIVNIAFFSGNKDFYREILMQLPAEISKRLQEINSSMKEIVNRRIPPILRLSPNNNSEDNEVYDDIQQYKLQDRLVDVRRYLIRIKSNRNLSPTFQEVYNKLDAEFENLSRDLEVSNQKYGFRKQNLFSFRRTGKRKRSIPLSQREVTRLEEKLDKFIELSEESDKLYEFLQISQQQLKHFDVEITNTREYLESTTSEVFSESSIDLSAGLEIIKSSIQLKGAVTANESEQYVQEYRSIITDELKERQLLRLLKNMSEHFNITFVIDELDKCSTATIVEMIDKNKRLFLDCNVSILLITDTSTAISLEETSDYVTEANIIVVPDLSVLDYIYRVNSKGMSIGNQFITILDSYFFHKMSNRELNYQVQPKNSSGFSKGFELYKFMNSSFYRGLNSLYKIIVLKFYWELLDLLDLVGELSEEEYNEFENKFYEQNELDSLKVKFIIRKLLGTIRSQSFEYFFTLEDDRSSYKQSEELKKFREIKHNLYDFLKQLSLKQTIISNDINFLKINNRIPQTEELYSFESDLSNYVKELGVASEQFREMLLQLSRPNLTFISNNMKMRFADKFYKPSDGVDNARLIIKRENTVGVILFYPYDHSENADPSHKPLRNGIIVTVNDFNEVVLYPYVGYVGLHSHKPQYLEKLKEELYEKNIPIYEVEDAIWDECFDKDDKSLEDKILGVCRSKIKYWLEQLRYLQKNEVINS